VQTRSHRKKQLFFLKYLPTEPDNLNVEQAISLAAGEAYPCGNDVISSA